LRPKIVVGQREDVLEHQPVHEAGRNPLFAQHRYSPKRRRDCFCFSPVS
jgi:hypothetical protein